MSASYKEMEVAQKPPRKSRECQEILQLLLETSEEKETINLKKENERLKEENSRLKLELENRYFDLFNSFFSLWFFSF